MAQIDVNVPHFLHLCNLLFVINRSSSNNAIEFLLEIVPVAPLEQAIPAVVEALGCTLLWLLFENYFTVSHTVLEIVKLVK